MVSEDILRRYVSGLGHPGLGKPESFMHYFDRFTEENNIQPGSEMHETLGNLTKIIVDQIPQGREPSYLEAA